MLRTKNYPFTLPHFNSFHSMPDFFIAHRSKIVIALKIIIAIDVFAIVLNYLHGYLQIDLIIPAPGKRLNNPIAIWMICLLLLGVFDETFRQRWTGRLKRWLTLAPPRYYLFASLIAFEIFLEAMHLIFKHSKQHMYWDLNLERGYGTYFSTFQLFLLTVVLIIIYLEEKKKITNIGERAEWYIAISSFFYLALDEVMGIHDRAGRYFNHWVDHNTFLYHTVHVWLWFYAPFILAAVYFLLKLFLRLTKDYAFARWSLFSGLGLWVFSILLEAIAKKRPLPGHILQSLEEGSEMLGATLLIFGLSLYLKKNYPVQKP